MKNKLSNRELNKWLGILGANEIQKLYIESRIYLTQTQLDYVIEYKKLEEVKK